jgi:integrase
MTFKELSEWYLKQEKVKALKSYCRIVCAVDNFNKALGHMVVKRITSVDLENYQAARKRQGKADATVDQEIGAAKVVINKAFENDLVSGKVLRTFKSVGKMLKPRANKRDRVLSGEEALSFAEKCPTHIRPVFLTAYWTGMRKGEILNLTWDKIDMKEKLIRLAGDDTKSGRSRTIPISQGLLEVLKTIPRAIHDPHVFLFRGKPVNDIRTSIKEGCEGAGIAYGRFGEGSFVFHDIRHTFNTDMRRAGVHLSVIMTVMGHEDPGMFFRYDTVDVEDLRQAMTCLEAYRGSVRQTVRQEAQAS